MKRVAIIQSSYIPWKGYFDIIHDVDEFIFMDDVQFTTRDWRTRNRIKVPNGLTWLSVPAGSDIRRRICDVRLNDHSWQAKHWKSISHSYGKTPFFSTYRPMLEELYLETVWDSLSDLNQAFIRRIAHVLGITTTMTDSRVYAVSGQKQERLIQLLQHCNASAYLSGPAARAYIDEQGFAEAGLELSFKDYGGYPEYDQIHPPFEHGVSILDLLFHAGPQAPDYIWGWRSGDPATPSKLA